ncbi:autotransporter domain-containing protein [Cognatiluteimonas weifangensis]|uniref:Autotransporter domain-containing protein n=1 Tax=Cognatiluteimonas weifangensis TaxID=2303539 RepID=A0A372DRN1_9GAMM|nr:autotransporter domain-containing protein [Luteimonas weifangensis]RFP62087.1 autotransporter domain-containing protein [Luteimonas weifangensis]
MTVSRRPLRTVLAAALALAAAPALAQDAFSQTVFFGDSLTDSGFYQTFLVENVDPSAAVVARFTTNPGLVWAQFLADYYGTDASAALQLTSTGVAATGGDNFAAGGATIAPGPGFPPQIPTQFAPSLTTQVGIYLAANGGQANPDALYTVWGGANDLFFHLNSATTQAQFLGAAAAEVGLVATLTSAGAQYIMVPNMPDVGATPFGLSLGATGSAGVTALVSAYNQTLFGGLQSAGLRVIPLDTFHFMQEIVANPGLYGFTNVTTPACGLAPALGCSPANFATPDADRTYAFADGVHPSTAAHEMLAQLAVSVIEAPRQMAVLPHAEAVVGRARAERVAAQLAQKPEADGMRWWADVRGDSQRYGEDVSNYDGGGASLMAGVDWTRGNLVYGAFAGYGRQGMDWGQRRGSFDQTDASLGGFAGWYGARAWVNGQVSYSWLGFDSDRDVQLGAATRTHSGSADGSNLSVGVSGGWTFGDGAFRHGPVASLLSQQIDIDGFAESDPTLSTSLAYPEQNVDSLIGSLGWQFSYTPSDRIHPYARVTFDHEFEDPAAQAFAVAQSIPGSLPYAVPGQDFDRDYGTLLLGARTRLLGLDANVGASATFAQEGGNDAGVFVTVGNRF